MHMLPASIETVDDLRALERAAQRVETRCGNGATVWHVWGDGEPLLLLHGGSGSWTHWVRNIAALAHAGWRVLVPDLPGFGASAKPPEGGDADAVAPWIERGLHELLGDAPCDIAAFSFGGIVASLLVAEHPRRARQLVLVGAPALSVEPVSRLGLRSWVHLPPGDERDALHRHNLGQMMLVRPGSVTELAIRLHDENMVRDRMPRRRLARTDIVAQQLPRIDCPLAGIWGAQDALYRGRIDRIAEVLRQAPRFRSLALLPDAGHWVQFESAETFNPLLIETLKAGREPQAASAPASASAPAPKA
jgi:2-hydroxy-6-oxonona-2,4-dienedioate hydrolase